MSHQVDILYSPTPPYEILQTPSMSYEDLCKVSNWSKMIDRFYNYSVLKSIIIDLVKEKIKARYETLKIYQKSRMPK